MTRTYVRTHPKEARGWAIVTRHNQIDPEGVREKRADLLQDVRDGERLQRVKIVAIA